MRVFKIIMVVLLLIFVVIQFIPTEKNSYKTIPLTDLMKTRKIPTKVEGILKTSCYDCHSNTTRYPWYSRIQPFAGILEKHIEDGKAGLNFSEFGNYSHRMQRSKFRSVISQIESGEMPLFSYELMHPEARLSEDEKMILTNWIEKMLERGDN